VTTGYPVAIDHRPIGAVQIFDKDLIVLPYQPGVITGNLAIVQGNIIIRFAAKG
jgi:hypothetical protein